jgi:hypothetical protein
MNLSVRRYFFCVIFETEISFGARMSDQSYLINDLKSEIAQQRVLIIAGAGVSIGATRGEQCASWTGLLKHGAERCEQIVPNLPKGWKEHVQAEIDSGDLDELVSAAQKILQKLSAPTSGVWLNYSCSK